VPFVASGAARCVVGARGVGGATLPHVHWFFTGLLIAVCAGTVTYTGWLLRRLFTSEPPR
jgi:hypothetical protein